MGVNTNGDAQIVGGCVYPGGGNVMGVIRINAAAGSPMFVLWLKKKQLVTLRVGDSSQGKVGVQPSSHHDRQH